MVGDHPTVVVQVEEPRLEVVLQARQGVSSSKEAEEFDWASYEGLMIAALIVPRNTDALVDYWRANINMLDWAKKVKPEVYEKVRLAFADRKQQLIGDR
jgi:hypothetical protein